MKNKIDFDEFIFKAVKRHHSDDKNDQEIRTRKKRKNKASWKDGLYAYIRGEDPAIVLRTKTGIFVSDKYPKAKIHLLLLPKETSSLFEREGGVEDLKKSDLKELREFHEAAKTFVRNHYKGQMFRIGYHKIPSMRPLHLHIISCDFQSDRLKNKKHWNSFTTSFFIETDKIEAELNRAGRVTVDRYAMKALLKSSLKCHGCDEILRNMPALKRHIKQCDTRGYNFEVFKA